MSEVLRSVTRDTDLIQEQKGGGVYGRQKFMLRTLQIIFCNPQ